MLLNSGKQQIDVLFLLETFLKSKTPDTLLEIAGYTLYRKDRCGVKKGGGILVYRVYQNKRNSSSVLNNFRNTISS